ncbi:hypothetical protein STRIP9103_03241 [Streptomyces ipomoeae 91-03]|uniref:Uncharacterized protein n=1 Tax=Streptomyces ipomoeae 91-03 TaxID=698759 RepID=L1KRS9_9ACTN|nr:hypothetical protein STRIP9103_03241 [Streptomyces ipomoeae 91-03]
MVFRVEPHHGEEPVREFGAAVRDTFRDAFRDVVRDTFRDAFGQSGAEFGGGLLRVAQQLIYQHFYPVIGSIA